MVYTVEAMWSRPMRIAEPNSSRALVRGASSCSSQTAEDWVMVTSLSTPNPEMISPQVIMPESERWSVARMSWYVFSSPAPVRCAAWVLQ